MCAIAGVVRFGVPGDALRSRVGRMLERQRHRGPDDSGAFAGPHVALAHARLALLDREGGAQPMRSPDGRYTLVYNGEVYNHDALRSMLADEWRFRTRSDAEVVLAAFARWGEDSLPRLDGMFAFFVWDEARRRGFAARDRLGVKPLAYRVEPGGIAFASEAQAIVHGLDQRPAADAEAVIEVLAAPCFSGVARSAFAGVALLQPGHLLEVDEDGVRTRPWWRLRLDPRELAAGGIEEAALVAELRAGLASAVERASRADVPVGVFLSGGLDSTLAAALMRGHVAGGPPAAFSLRFPDQCPADFESSRLVLSDDAPFADLAAKELGLPHVIVPVEPRTLEADIAAVAAANDAIPAWEQERAQHHLARAAARSHKAVVVGDAADETHFGYHFLLDDEAIRDPAVILRRLGPVPMPRELTGGEDAIEYVSRTYRAIAREHGDGDTRTARVLGTTALILLRWLPRLLYNGDVHTMRFSLEARVPFADPALVDTALRVHPSFGLRGGIEKHALRRAAMGLLPESIRIRRKSALPKDLRVANELRVACARVLAEQHPIVERFVDVAAVRTLLSPARSLDEGERAALFRITALARWAEHHGVAAP